MTTSLTDHQRDIVIRTVLGEARGEGRDGMAAVAHVVRNRTLSGEFSSDPAKVALQPKQFSVWNEGAGGGRTTYNKDSALYKHAAEIVDGVFGGQIADNTGGSTYYHTKGVNPSWADGVNQAGTQQIGNHVFYPQSGSALAAIDRAAPAPQSRPESLAYAPGAGGVQGLLTASLPTGGNSDPQTALDRVATRERNRVTPASADDRVNARNRAWIAATPAAPTVASIPIGPAPQDAKYVDRMAQAPAPSAPITPLDLLSTGVMGNVFDSLNNDPVTAMGLAALLAPKVADLPQRGKSSVLEDYAYNRTQPGPQPKAAPRPAAAPQRVAAASNTGSGSNSDYFGSLIARVPSAPPLFAERDTTVPSNASVVATLPTVRSPISPPPSTRTVQTTPVTPRPNSVAQARTEQAVQRQVAPPAPRAASIPASVPRIDGIGAGTSWAQLTGTLGNPGRAKTSQVAINEDRLLPGLAYTGQSLPPMTPSPAIGLAHLSGQVTPAGKRIAVPIEAAPRVSTAPRVATASGALPPLPRPMPELRVASQLDVLPDLPMQASAPPVPGGKVAPVPVDLKKPMPTQKPGIEGLFSQQNILGAINNRLGIAGALFGIPQALSAMQRAAPIGASLGIGRNGGKMAQGHTGVLNSLSTPESYINQVNANMNKAGVDMSFLDRVHSGLSNNYTSLGNGSFMSEGGGVYHDRHVNR